MEDVEISERDGVSKIVLHGRLDTPGVGRIETRFTAAAVAPGRNAIVDLSRVTFISSTGIGLLLSAARALHLKSAKIVAFGAQPLVQESVANVAPPELLPIAPDEAAALALLKSA